MEMAEGTFSVIVKDKTSFRYKYNKHIMCLHTRDLPVSLCHARLQLENKQN